MQIILGEDGSRARREMQEALLRIFFLLILVSSAGLLLRELLMGGPIVAAAVSTSVSLGTYLWSRHGTAPVRLLGAGLCLLLVALIGQAAFALGGAAGSALSFSFIPGLLAMLVLTPRWGVIITALMLAVHGALWMTSSPADALDQLRFQDEILMTLFAAGLGYAMTRALEAYERSVAARKHALLRALSHRRTLAKTIYEKIEPVAEQLSVEVESAHHAEDFDRVTRVVKHLSSSLDAARGLAVPEGEPVDVDGDAEIRVKTMRIWLRIGAVFIFVVMVRNLALGYAFAPSLFSFSCCLIFDFWLRKLRKPKQLEWIALLIGAAATAPLIGHIWEYGPTPDAPALVVTPSVVLFTALLSQGPATWAVVLLQMTLLGWVGWDRNLTLLQARLLGDLLLDFLVVAIAVRWIFQLRRRFAATLHAQGLDLLAVGRRQRRLAGMLFHDARNHLQVLALYAEAAEEPEMRAHARSLSRRVVDLVHLSKRLLLDESPEVRPRLSSVDLNQVVEALLEAYGPRMDSKGLRMDVNLSQAPRVLAEPEVLVDSVMGNLLSNAIKFSPAGSVIGLQSEPHDSFVRVALSDEGQGVPPEVLESLGQDGPVPSQAGTAGESGQGYGLQLVDEHVTKMGGRLTLEKRLPRGTSAVIWLKSG